MNIRALLAAGMLCGGLAAVEVRVQAQTGAGQNQGELYFISSTNSEVAHGLTGDVSSKNFVFIDESDKNIPGDLDFHITSQDKKVSFDLHFETANGAPFETGLYPNAASSDGAQSAHPIFSFSSSLGGYQDSTGYFNVEDLQKQSDGHVTSGLFIFHQEGEIGMTGNGSGSGLAPFEDGYLRFDLAPASVPEPSAFVLLGLGVLALFLKARRQTECS